MLNSFSLSPQTLIQTLIQFKLTAESVDQTNLNNIICCSVKNEVKSYCSFNWIVFIPAQIISSIHRHAFTLKVSSGTCCTFWVNQTFHHLRLPEKLIHINSRYLTNTLYVNNPPTQQDHVLSDRKDFR